MTLFGATKGSDGDVVVVGLPFDHGSTLFPGCAKAPEVLRRGTNGLRHAKGHFYNQATREAVLSDLKISDLGDFLYRSNQTREAYLVDVAKLSATLFAAGKRVLALGGDHLVTLPMATEAARALGGIQVVQIDAHTDYQPVQAPGEVPSHANYVHFLALEPAVERIIQIGVRGWSRDLYPLPEKVVQCTPEQLAETLLPGRPVYLTVDTDGFDPVVAPAVGHPHHGGLAWNDMGRILEALQRARAPLVAADWTEYNPDFDTKNYLTAMGIVACLIQVVGALAPVPRSSSSPEAA